MIDQLIQSGCIQVGNFTLKNGEVSKYYFDIRKLISYPKLLAQVGDALYLLMGDFDIICGIPYGALPLATYISVTYNKPMIYVRDKQKEYGMKNLIEGNYEKTDRCVLLDDVITSGGSIQRVYDIIKGEVNVVKTVVVLDRQQEKHCKIHVDCLLNKTDVIQYRLYDIQKRKNSKLCFAGDLVDDLPRLWSIIAEIGKRLVICKIHMDIVPVKDRDEFKAKIMELSIQYDFLVMEDRKFNDISQIVQKQYKQFENWVDMVTVHSLVAPEVIQVLSGAVIVANMSNNTYDFSTEALAMAIKHKRNVIGFVSQKRIQNTYDFITMTPGITIKKDETNYSDADQKYRSMNDVDTDIFIIGRSIYNSTKQNDDK